jgi:hypothetical protein
VGPFLIGGSIEIENLKLLVRFIVMNFIHYLKYVSEQSIRQKRLLQKSQMDTLPYPSHQGRGLFINPLPWWERARVRE